MTTDIAAGLYYNGHLHETIIKRKCLDNGGVLLRALLKLLEVDCQQTDLRSAFLSRSITRKILSTRLLAMYMLFLVYSRLQAA